MTDIYRFGRFVLDSRRRTLSRAGTPVLLTPKAFDVLLFLVQHPNRLVTKEELLQTVWGDAFVEEGNLTQYISHLRKALGGDGEGGRLIVTLARKGYQFTGSVNVVGPADAAKHAAQAATIEDSGVDASVAQTPRTREVPSAPPLRWWKASLVLVTAIVLVIGVISWRSRVAALATSQKVMLAVLPFQNLTGDPGKEYLADGLTEEMISRLARLSQDQLGVIARTSVMGYKHTEQRLDQIGRDLSVQYVLESSLRDSGDHLRLTAQLIKVKDQTHLWSEDYDYTATDILAVEESVASAVAQEVRLRLTSQQPLKSEPSPPVSPEALNAYMQGFYFFQRNTSKDSEMAAKYFERAIELDNSYGLAWVGLSRVRNWQVNIGVLPADEGHRLARQAIARALALSPNLAAAHAQMARLAAQLDFDWAKVADSGSRAMALEPGNAEIVRMVGGWETLVGRLDEGVRLQHRAADLDPLNPESWEELAAAEYHIGQLDRAAEDGRKALNLSADVWPGSILLSQIYVMQGHYQDALREIERIRFESIRPYLYAIAYHALGRQRESDIALNELISKYPDEFFIGAVYAFRQQPDEAFEWLDKAYAHHDSGLVQLKVDPFLKNLRHDPRYAALLKKLNFPS